MEKVRSLLIILFVSALILNGCKKEEDPVTAPSEHFSPEGWIFYNKSQNSILIVSRGQIQQTWDSSHTEEITDTFKVMSGQLSGLTSVRFLDSGQSITDPPADPDHELAWIVTDTSYIDVIQSDTLWNFELRGKKPGTTTLEFQVLHEGHADVRTPKIPVRVE